VVGCHISCVIKEIDMNIRNAIIGLVFSSLMAVGCEAKDVAAAPDVVVAVVPEVAPAATPPVVCDCPPVVCDPAGQCCTAPVLAAEPAAADVTAPAVVPAQPPAVVAPVAK
jgi:hypothetical protein